MSAFGDWRYTADREATATAYRRVSVGDAVRCGCSGCRNFVAVRNQVLPQGFVDLLEDLGIDSTKEGEVYTEGAAGPGAHFYGGWYHFVGTLDVTGDFPPVEYAGGFISYMCNKSTPCLPELEGLSLIQLEFRAQNVPWVIADEEPL